ncbi:hypothetical protein [Marivita cryptomonadis]|uniref:hypothetical protein n=1 Tax=Marivita cryptomonadis TaxID=505252 RepID=UPI0039198BB5
MRRRFRVSVKFVIMVILKRPRRRFAAADRKWRGHGKLSRLRDWIAADDGNPTSLDDLVLEIADEHHAGIACRGAAWSRLAQKRSASCRAKRPEVRQTAMSGSRDASRSWLTCCHASVH